MPIYEYECLDCGKRFEIFQKISEEPLKECRACGGRLNRLISQCSFQLKGTGWYVTDYKSPAGATKGNGGKQGEKKDEKAETKADSGTETVKSEATGGAA
jgi:putative FmdB family regulatory protein